MEPGEITDPLEPPTPLDELARHCQALIDEHPGCEAALADEYADTVARVEVVQVYMGEGSEEEHLVCKLARQNMELIIVAYDKGFDLLKN